MKIKENQSIFLQYFGDSPKLRVIDFLIDFQMFDYPITSIARESNVSYNSLILFFEKWLEQGIIIRTRKIGKSDYYQLNIKHPFVSNLIKLDWLLSTKDIKQELNQKVIA